VVEAVNPRLGIFRVANRYGYSDLSGLDISWDVREDGMVVQNGALPHLHTPPGASDLITVPYQRPAEGSGAETVLTLHFALGADAPWASRGHEVAWAQFLLSPAAEAAERDAELPPVTLKESDGAVIVTGENFALRFDRATGRLVEWTHGGRAVVASGPALNLYRAPTDNDAPRMAGLWQKAGFDRLLEAVKSVSALQVAPGCVEVTVETTAAAPDQAPLASVRYVYSIYGDGEVALHHEVQLASKPAPTGKTRWRRGDTLLDGLPPLPRVGVTLELPAGAERIRWYGRGPHETHSDRLLSGWLGVHETTASEPDPYVKPQEHGNRTGVRWVALTDETGAGLLATGAPQIEFSAHHYAARDMVGLRHPHEVVRRPEVVLNLDTAQAGLGTEACGPGVLPEYELVAQEYSYTVRLRPLIPA
jgi:beta-galactosidase/beta-glucuronidase